MCVKQDGPVDDSTLTMFSILDMAYDKQLKPHQKLPRDVVGPGIRATLERYLDLQGKELQFNDTDQMEDFAKFKKQEVEGLRLHLSKIPTIDAYYHDYLKKLLATKGPKQSLEIGEGMRLLKLVRRVKEILPKSIETNDGIQKDLAERIKKAQQKKEKIHNLQRSADEFQRLVRERDALSTWASAVVPSSDAYASVISRYDEVVRKLGEFKDGFLDSLRSDREALEEELPALLTVKLGRRENEN